MKHGKVEHTTAFATSWDGHWQDMAGQMWTYGVSIFDLESEAVTAGLQWIEKTRIALEKQQKRLEDHEKLLEEAANDIFNAAENAPKKKRGYPVGTRILTVE